MPLDLLSHKAQVSGQLEPQPGRAAGAFLGLDASQR